MSQFALRAAQTSGDFPKGMGSPQVAKEHGHELPPAGKASGMTFSLGLLNSAMEFISGKQL